MTEHPPLRDLIQAALTRLGLATLYLALFAMAWYAVNGCSKEKIDPLSDRIKRTWTAQAVRENSTLVFTKGATANIRNYNVFRLDLSTPPAVKLTDFDGNTFVGTYVIQGETKLILSALQPEPTGTGGTIEFTINSATGMSLDITRTTASPKTGNSLNQYQLTGN
ncbi:hypothetical protein [uncultured Fibrella sp.]|uniref:hypothetical protein n=1 Tax=uncultured Fibrella sp. TaxID=1284596 RepID=UPI0035C9C645